jgi:hypothetical protein
MSLLPNELLQMIFEQLDQKDLKNCANAHKRFADLIYNTHSLNDCITTEYEITISDTIIRSGFSKDTDMTYSIKTPKMTIYTTMPYYTYINGPSPNIIDEFLYNSSHDSAYIISINDYHKFLNDIENNISTLFYFNKDDNCKTCTSIQFDNKTKLITFLDKDLQTYITTCPISRHLIKFLYLIGDAFVTILSRK